MDFERSDSSEDDRKGHFCSGDGNSSVSCSICLELVLDRGQRSIAKLQCGHEFHLDCIGSAFNAKGSMQCPNCRKVEKGQWLYANGLNSSADELGTEDLYDLGYSDLPFGFQWCPFRGFMQLSSVFEDAEPQPNAYHEPLRNAAFGDNSNASGSHTHLCPYLALHGFPHPIHPTLLNAVADAVPDAASSFPRHPTGLGLSPVDMVNSHSFSAPESHPHNWLQAPHPFSVSGGTINNGEQLSQLAIRLSRNDSSSQQRLRFVNPLHFIHGSGVQVRSSLAASFVPPIVGDTRGHSFVAGNHHIYQQSPSSSSSLRSAPFVPIRRSRARGLALISSVGVNFPAESSGFPVGGSLSSTHRDAEMIGGHSDRIYGWVREGFVPLPWAPVESHSHWSPFHPNQNHQQAGGADLMVRNNLPEMVTEDNRVAQRRLVPTYQRVRLPRMSPW